MSAQIPQQLSALLTLVRDLPQASELLVDTSASDRLGDEVELRLSMEDTPDLERRSREIECTAVEPLSLSSSGDHLETDTDLESRERRSEIQSVQHDEEG